MKVQITFAIAFILALFLQHPALMITSIQM